MKTRAECFSSRGVHQERRLRRSLGCALLKFLANFAARKATLP